MGSKKMQKDDLGNRMKGNYETISKTRLTRRTPVVIRIDGKAFHTFTRGFLRPFDPILIEAMQETMKYLCENIQGCVLGYCQSDEISLVLIDYKKLDSSAWFDYEVQKMVSVSASMATMRFNQVFRELVEPYLKETDENDRRHQAYDIAIHNRLAMFDSRAFNIPKEEVTNYIYWRQIDASRNSVQMVGQANFSRKQLHQKSGNDIQDMLMTEKGINWNNFSIVEKRGSCAIKEEYYVDTELGEVEPSNVPNKEGLTLRTRWVVDKEIPIFKGENREYVDKLIYVGD